MPAYPGDEFIIRDVARGHLQRPDNGIGITGGEAETAQLEEYLQGHICCAFVAIEKRMVLRNPQCVKRCQDTRVGFAKAVMAPSSDALTYSPVLTLVQTPTG